MVNDTLPAALGVNGSGQNLARAAPGTSPADDGDVWQCCRAAPGCAGGWRGLVDQGAFIDHLLLQELTKVRSTPEADWCEDACNWQVERLGGCLRAAVSPSAHRGRLRAEPGLCSGLGLHAQGAPAACALCAVRVEAHGGHMPARARVPVARRAEASW